MRVEHLAVRVIVWCLALIVLPTAAQPDTAAASRKASAQALRQEFFDALKQGDAKRVLQYVPPQGINTGARPEHVTHAEVEQQFLHHRGLYCRLFDSSCIETSIRLDASAASCSYRELLNHSESVRTAASETVRSGVTQAILVAEVKNSRCGGTRLIDFIFNREGDGWRLFSVP